MKVSFNKKVVNSIWGGGNQMLKLLVEHFKREGVEVSYSLDEDTDVVLIMDIRDKYCTFPLIDVQKAKKKGVRVVHRVNDNGSHRQNDDIRDSLTINYNRSVADKTIFISNWLKYYFEGKGLVVDGAEVIENGVDKDVFCRSNRIRKPDEPIRVVTHHWSNNPSKGYSIYNDLSNFCHYFPEIAHFRFFGQCPKGQLENCEKLPPKTYLEVPKFLNTEDLYVTATQCESGGCHIVEGMSCGLIPIVSSTSGGPEEYARDFGLNFQTVDELICHIESLSKDYDYYLEMKEKMNNYVYGSEDMCRHYLDVVKSVI